MKIKITSDSTCDLSPELLRENDIELFPLFINKGDESFRDGVDIQPADIFAHVAAGGALCSTAAVPGRACSTTALPSWQRNMTPCSM